MIAGTPVDEGWNEAGRSAGVVIYRREHEASGLNETLAIGAVDAPPWVVKNALDDYEAKDGAMPYITEMRVLRRDEKGALIYHRTSPPLITDRDYTIRMFDESFVRSDGAVVYICRWRTANDEGPPVRSGVVRIEKTEGYWRLEPIDDGARTRATYFVFITPGGAIPHQITDWGTTTVMGGIFDALRARAAQPKYAKDKPAAPGHLQAGR